MLAAVRWAAVAVGVGTGALVATLLALAAWALLAALGVADAPLIGLTFSVLVGFAVGGYASARLAPVAHRFHGSIAGLGLAGLVVVVALAGGSPAGTGQILLLALLAVVLGGVGGVVGGRRR